MSDKDKADAARASWADTSSDYDAWTPPIAVSRPPRLRPDMAQTDSDAGKPATRPAPRNPWPLVGMLIVVATVAVSGYALWRAAVAIW